MKIFRKVTIIFIILVFVASLFVACKESDLSKTYENAISSALLDNNPRIVDISLLGAHDMFSMDININSKSNIYEDSVANNSFVQTLAKKIAINQSIAQSCDTLTLLNYGVRFIDLRLTLIDGIYYTCHGFISDEFSKYLLEMLKFLNNNPGEFLIIDFQHFYTENGQDRSLSDLEWQNLFNFIKTVKYNDKNLLDYVYYNSNENKLSELRYFDVTKNKQDAGVILLIPNKSLSYAYYRDYGPSDGAKLEFLNIRSHWHNRYYLENLKQDVLEEVEHINNNMDIYKDVLRVCQYISTPFSDNSYLDALRSQSLLNTAVLVNLSLIEDETYFKNIQSAMPIILIDNTIMQEDDFIFKINSWIFNYNSNLKE